ncbi:hypothetical protein F0U44_13855 [Nocardioides humilatus]|uniref:Uncharacterized protein n=1 Tax=Nocardioides humilatus TaxID=2607660 RepID=A0A5B1LIU1_9ACTN|nr:hypothetical protein [Nocardioides humilatus]KAA1419507.1 hypothetical protein F0U44_13855 [Nocardioides humilatus]
MTFGKVLAGTAVLLIWTGGTAYAAATITGADIVDATIKSVDVGDNSVASVDVLNATLTQADLADGSVGSSEVTDFSLSNADVGVLFAQVSANGNLAGTGGGAVSAISTSPGTYRISFGRPITACAFSVTPGPAGALLDAAPPAIAQVGEQPADPLLVLVLLSDLEGNAINTAFTLVAVC